LEKIGLIYHPRALNVLDDLTRRIAGKKPLAWSASLDELDEVQNKVADSELILVLGGDGTMLRSARVASPHGVLLLGLNLGSVGFLTEANPARVEDIMDEVLAGRYEVEERMTIKATLKSEERPETSFVGLNEVVLARGSAARAVKISIEVNQIYFRTYRGDGVMVSTPTGSTAYSFSAGGPILLPLLPNLVITPICPHISLCNSLVISDKDKVTLQFLTHHDGVLAVDGYLNLPVHHLDRIEIAANNYPCRFVKTRFNRSFFELLTDKMFPDSRPNNHGNKW